MNTGTNRRVPGPSGRGLYSPGRLPAIKPETQHPGGIENNKFLFYVSVGLTASGYDGYDHDDAAISALVGQIHAAGFSDEVKAWFACARTGQVELNPYRPRGAALAAACFFMDDDYTFDFSHFLSFLKRAGVSDPVGKKDFKSWAVSLPDILRDIDGNPATEGLWNEYCRIINERSSEWQKNMKTVISIVRQFFIDKYKNSLFEISFAPNLFTPYSTDLVRVRERIIVVSPSPDIESMLHEAMHVAVTKYWEKFTSHAGEYGLGNFADREKMGKFGYMPDDTAASAARVIEECFVRALAVILSRGNDERLQAHTDSGFYSVPFIGWNLKQIKISYLNLGEFIDDILIKMRREK